MPFGRLRYLLAALLLTTAAALYAAHHAARLFHQPGYVVAVDALGFTWLAFCQIASHTHRDITPSPHQRQELDRLRVTVVVPLKNEDPAVFRMLLDSVADQTRLPQRLHVIDNGSSTRQCRDVYRQWARSAPPLLETEYATTGPIGKRSAQTVAFNADPDADIFVTVDSDTVLDAEAVAEGLAPFIRPQVMAVAGVLASLNWRANLLTRLVDLPFVTSFLNGRAAWSRLGSVVVSCGGLAFYRASVVRKYRAHYLSQRVCGRRVATGDDRMLTCYALLEGRTVLQERSFGYTLSPENLSHLTRQRVRWWRSFFWGGAWLIREFPLTRIAWWLVLWQFVCFALYTMAVPVVLVVHPVRTGELGWSFVVFMAVLSYVRSMRYLLWRRPDQSRVQQLGAFALAPLCAVLNLYLCGVLQVVGLLTFARTGWSTRAHVEVGVREPQALASDASEPAE